MLATGVVAANSDFDVYLGIAEPAACGTDLAASLCYGGGDRPTTKHLAGFDYAFEKGDRSRIQWPVRAVEDIAPPPRSRHRGPIEPFFGAPLELWARRCAAAPNGVLYDRVRKRQMTEMRTSTRDEKVEAAVIGSLPLGPDLPAVSLTTWLKSRADRGRPATPHRRAVGQTGLRGQRPGRRPPRHGRRGRGGACPRESHHQRRRSDRATHATTRQRCRARDRPGLPGQQGGQPVRRTRDSHRGRR